MNPPDQLPMSAVQSGRLALAFQEAFVVAIRLHTGRATPSDSDTFRRHVKQLLVRADEEARSEGYHKDIVRLAIYGYISLLDEIVLNSTQAIFGDWPRRPLQEEIFGDLRAGETFYRNLQDLLSSPNTATTGDVLEVYLICLLLGFRGRYGSADNTTRNALISQCHEKIGQIRGGPGELAPSWRPPADEDVRPLVDPWIRRLSFAAIGLVLVAVTCFAVYSVTLGSATAGIETLAEEVPQ